MHANSKLQYLFKAMFTPGVAVIMVEIYNNRMYYLPIKHSIFTRDQQYLQYIQQSTWQVISMFNPLRVVTLTAHFVGMARQRVGR